MNDMIERVAMALDPICFKSGYKEGQEDARIMARAAIEAMLEPTNQMHKAMCECYNSPACIWMTGIKQALAAPNGE
jgi:hypothetical protein